MKKLLSVVILFIWTVASYAQQDVTKFLGIPVDGTKSAMIQKLKAKGFTYNQTFDYLKGEFNGTSVKISVVTNNNKVFRIAIQDAYPISEIEIKIRFNKLCNQFENNKKYISLSSDSYTLPEGEKISDEILLNKKRYEAAYYQESKEDYAQKIMELVATHNAKYTAEQLANPTEEMRQDLNHMTGAYLDSFTKKSVWFMIAEEGFDKYRIFMFYDNEYNRSNGEEL